MFPSNYFPSGSPVSQTGIKIIEAASASIEKKSFSSIALVKRMRAQATATVKTSVQTTISTVVSKDTSAKVVINLKYIVSKAEINSMKVL